MFVKFICDLTVNFFELLCDRLEDQGEIQAGGVMIGIPRPGTPIVALEIAPGINSF